MAQACRLMMLLPITALCVAATSDEACHADDSTALLQGRIVGGHAEEPQTSTWILTFPAKYSDDDIKRVCAVHYGQSKCHDNGQHAKAAFKGTAGDLEKFKRRHPGVHVENKVSLAENVDAETGTWILTFPAKYSDEDIKKVCSVHYGQSKCHDNGQHAKAAFKGTAGDLEKFKRRHPGVHVENTVSLVENLDAETSTWILTFPAKYSDEDIKKVCSVHYGQSKCHDNGQHAKAAFKGTAGDLEKFKRRHPGVHVENRVSLAENDDAETSTWILTFPAKYSDDDIKTVCSVHYGQSKCHDNGQHAKAAFKGTAGDLEKFKRRHPGVHVENKVALAEDADAETISTWTLTFPAKYSDDDIKQVCSVHYGQSKCHDNGQHAKAAFKGTATDLATFKRTHPGVQVSSCAFC